MKPRPAPGLLVSSLLSVGSRLALVALVGLALGLATHPARAQTAGAPPPPDDTLLGTVEVDGSAGGLPPLPKLGVVPLPAAGEVDRTARAVVRNDLDLSGSYEVLGDDKAPDPLATRESPIDLAAWRGKGAEVVLRVFAEVQGTTSQIVAEAYLTAATPGSPAVKPVAGAAVDPPKPLYRGVFPVGSDARAASHRATDEVLGALTGRPGSFASHLTFAQRTGQWQSAQIVDPDGHGQVLASPADGTVLSPAFGPGGALYYVISRDFGPFRVATGAAATPSPLELPGSALGLAFSPDGARTAVTVMRSGKSAILVGDSAQLVGGGGAKLTELPAAPLAHHPAFGPLGKIAYVGGAPVQRVHIDGAAVSPAGFMASAPAFCDSAQGLLVVFTVEVQGGAELVATDTRGGGMRRLTQRQGDNRYPACSPDGRMVAFFSTTKSGAGPGLYVMPVLRPWLAKKVASGLGQSIRWERLPSK